MIYREQILTRIEDFDQQGNMTPAGLLKVFENAAQHHAASVQDDAVENSIAGIAWVLTQWRVEIGTLPRHDQTLFIETWTVGTPPTSRTSRELVLKDDQGRVLVQGSATFVMFDRHTQRITRIDARTLAKYQPEPMLLFPEKPPRLQMGEPILQEAVLHIRKADVDYNGHVHNTAYLDFAQEVLPDMALRRFRIVYHRQLLHGMPVTLRRCQQEGRQLVAVVSGEEVCTLMEFEE